MVNNTGGRGWRGGGRPSEPTCCTGMWHTHTHNRVMMKQGDTETADQTLQLILGATSHERTPPSPPLPRVSQSCWDHFPCVTPAIPIVPCLTLLTSHLWPRTSSFSNLPALSPQLHLRKQKPPPPYYPPPPHRVCQFYSSKQGQSDPTVSRFITSSMTTQQLEHGSF